MHVSLIVLAAMLQVASSFNVSRTLGNHMVLQRAPRSAVVWGQAAPGTVVQTTFLGQVLTATAGADQVWRQALPPQPATTGTATGITISFNASTGESAVLEDVLFGGK